MRPATGFENMETKPHREFPLYFLANHDGDTVTASIDLGFKHWIIGAPVRLFGVNCPELKTEQGPAAKEFTRAWFAQRHKFTLIQAGDGYDKYGRLLGSIRGDDGAVLNDDLLTSGHAVVMKD